MVVELDGQRLAVGLTAIDPHGAAVAIRADTVALHLILEGLSIVAGAVFARERRLYPLDQRTEERLAHRGRERARRPLAQGGRREFAERIIFSMRPRILQNRHQALAFNRLGRRQSGQRAERGVNVERLDNRRRRASVARQPGRADDEGHPRADLVIRRFAPDAVFAEVPAVIAPEHHDGVVAEAERVELREDASDLGVDEAHAGRVGVEQLARRRLVDRPGGRHAGAGAQFERTVPRDRRSALRRLGRRRERQGRRIVEIEIFLGRNEGQVRLDEADAEEEGRALQLAQCGDRDIGGLAVDVGVVGSVGRFPRRASGHPAFDRAELHERGLAALLHDGLAGRQLIAAATGPAGADAPARPRVGVIRLVAVKNLADVARVIAVLFEELRQRDDLRHGVAKEGVDVLDLERARAKAGEHRGA